MLLLSDQPVDPVTASGAKPTPASVLDTKLNLGDRVFGEVEKHSFMALPGRGPQQAECVLTQVVRSFIVKETQRGGRCDPLTDLPLTGGW